MSSIILVAVISDLMASTRIRGMAERAGITWNPVNTEHDFRAAMERSPAGLILDAKTVLSWRAWLLWVKETPSMGSVSKLAFVSHMNLAAQKELKSLGVEHVIPRSEMDRYIPVWIDWLAAPHGEDPARETLPKAAQRGVTLFNEGKFFDQHEWLELAWRVEPRPVRELYRGMLLVGVACYQWERGNPEGALKQLKAGLSSLESLEPVCQGVNVDRLRGESRRLLEDMEKEAVHFSAWSSKAVSFPKILSEAQS